MAKSLCVVHLRRWVPILSVALASVASLALSGCATNQPVQQIGANEYTLYRVDHAGVFGSATALRNSVLTDANAFAAARGDIAVPISAKSHPVGILGDFAWFRYTFRLAKKTDKTAAAIHLIPGTDVVVDGRGEVLGSSAIGGGVTLPAQAGDGDRVERMASDLRTLESLRAQGIITQAQFETERQKVLASKGQLRP